MGLGSFLKKATGVAIKPIKAAHKATMGAAKMAHKATTSTIRKTTPRGVGSGLTKPMDAMAKKTKMY
jgi:hypothetical protein